MRKTWHFTIFVLGSLLTAGCDHSSGDPRSDACGAIGLEPKIIGGTECLEDRSPIVRVLSGDPNFPESFGLICSGTLITSSFVLTAGHCTSGFEDPALYRIRVGTHDVGARNVYTHPSFGDFGMPIDENNPPPINVIPNDSALIELDTPITDREPLPIIVGKPVVPGDRIQIYGYGIDSFNELDILRSGEMEVEKTEGSVLFALFGRSGSNTCYGDSGGPALLRYFPTPNRSVIGVVGTTSAGTSPLCNFGDESTFGFVQSDSILEFIRDHVPDVTFG